MKKIIMLMAVLPVCAFVMAQQINDPNAEVRDVKNFTGIKISSAFDVYLNQSNVDAVAVSASEQKYRDRIKVTVENSILSVGYDNEKGGWKGWNNDKTKLKVYISFKQLNSLKVSGACDVKMEGVVKSDELLLEFSGASDLKKANLNVNKLNIELTGASDVSITGTATNLKLTCTGASDFKGFDLATDYSDVSATGASSIKITVNKELSVRATGASDVYYKGTGLIREVKSTGASSVSRKS
jgi:Putative auto-transporter adhesin, head GIN domain